MDGIITAAGTLKIDLPDNPHVMAMEQAGIRCVTEIACHFEARRLLLNGEITHIEVAEHKGCRSFAITFKWGGSFEFDVTDNQLMVVQSSGCELSVADGALVVGQQRYQRSQRGAA